MVAAVGAVCSLCSIDLWVNNLYQGDRGAGSGMLKPADEPGLVKYARVSSHPNLFLNVKARAHVFSRENFSNYLWWGALPLLVGSNLRRGRYCMWKRYGQPRHSIYSWNIVVVLGGRLLALYRWTATNTSPCIKRVLVGMKSTPSRTFFIIPRKRLRQFINLGTSDIFEEK